MRQVIPLILVALLAAAILLPSDTPAADESGLKIFGVDSERIELAFTGSDGATSTLDRKITIEGTGFYGTSFGPWVRFLTGTGESIEAEMVVIESAERILAWPPAGTHGQVTVVVENPDHHTAAYETML